MLFYASAFRLLETIVDKGFPHGVPKASGNAREAIADDVSSSANARAKRQGVGPPAPDDPSLQGTERA